jgi:hypothetical protein
MLRLVAKVSEWTLYFVLLSCRLPALLHTISDSRTLVISMLMFFKSVLWAVVGVHVIWPSLSVLKARVTIAWILGWLAFLCPLLS